MKRVHKTAKKDLGATSLGSIVDEMFNPKGNSQPLSRHFPTVLMKH